MPICELFLQTVITLFSTIYYFIFFCENFQSKLRWNAYFYSISIYISLCNLCTFDRLL